MQMNILITGDAGFVGRAFHRYLDGAGHTIVGVDIVNGLDARDFFKVDNRHFDLVIHLAAIVGGRQTIEGNPLAVAVDLAIDSDLFQWALRTQPGRIVYFSSSAAYPIALQEDSEFGSLQEDDIDLKNIETPDMSYGWSKLTGEMLASHYRAKGGKVSIFRPFSGYGADQALDYPFPSFIMRAKNRANPFAIWGNGQQTRDWIHIDDVIEGVFAGIKADIEVANLCTGYATSFNDLAVYLADVVGYLPKFQHLTDEPSGVMYRVGDPTYMNTFYIPKISIQEGIQRALTA